MNQITLSENVMVSDPCYSTDTWCQTKLDNVLGLMSIYITDAVNRAGNQLKIKVI